METRCDVNADESSLGCADPNASCRLARSFRPANLQRRLGCYYKDSAKCIRPPPSAHTYWTGRQTGRQAGRKSQYSANTNVESSIENGGLITTHWRPTVSHLRAEATRCAEAISFVVCLYLRRSSKSAAFPMINVAPAASSQQARIVSFSFA